MVKINWEGSANGEQDIYILIAQRMSAFKLIGKIYFIRKLVNDKEAGLTFNLHIQDSKMRDPFWIITDVYGYKNYNEVKLCRVKFSDQKWWAIRLPKGSFTGQEEIFFDGIVSEPDYIRWIVKDTSWIITEDCKTWSLSLNPDSLFFTETDPVFKIHPAFNITQSQINEFHKALTLNPDLKNGLELIGQQLGLNLATTESAGAMSPEDKAKLDQLELGEYYPLYENPAGYLTEETDPVFKLSPAYLIKSTDIARWNDAYYWGNHALYGYLTEYNETDPIFRNHASYNIDHGDIVKWNEAAERTPVLDSYVSLASMVADQANQLKNYIYYNRETSTYYEFLGPISGDFTDYREVGGEGLTNNEVKTINITYDLLSGTGTIEQQVCDYINNNLTIEYTKQYSKINIVLKEAPMIVVPIRMTESVIAETSSFENFSDKTYQEIKDSYIRSWFPQRGYSYPPLYFEDGDPIEVGSIVYLQDGQLSGLTGKYIFSRNMPPDQGYPYLDSNRPILILDIVDSVITNIVDIETLTATPIYITWGNIYNDYAIRDARKITSSDDWVIPSVSDWQTLQTYIGGSTEAGKLTIFGSNEFKFNSKLSGRREPWGAFAGFFSSTSYFDSRLPAGAPSSGSVVFLNTQMTINNAGRSATQGMYVRLIKTSTTLTHGQSGTYVANNGVIHRTICIGTQEWLADNLIETQYRNGDSIPNVTNNSTWQSLTTGAMCYYNNDVSVSYYIY